MAAPAVGLSEAPCVKQFGVSRALTSRTRLLRAACPASPLRPQERQEHTQLCKRSCRCVVVASCRPEVLGLAQGGAAALGLAACGTAACAAQALMLSTLSTASP